MLSIDVLTTGEMEEIDQRQARQQAEWKATPPDGRIVNFFNMEILVLPGVFPPKEDTTLLAEHLRVRGTEAVLDVGTGTGALAIWAAKKGAVSVVAVDIAEAAVRNAQRNVERQGLVGRVDVRAGHVFSSIAPSESFDIILANLPGRNKVAVDDISAAQWDTGFRAHRALFEGARAHLRPGGLILMVKANYPDLLEMVDLAKMCRFNVSVIARSTSRKNDPRRYYVLSLTDSRNDQS